MSSRLLLVEDDPDLSTLAALHLRDEGHEVEVVADGLLAAQRVAEQKYDLILSDLMLPGMDGLEICRRIRASQDFTPLIILTAKTSEVDRVLGLELGADDYLTKPFSLRELIARVRAALRRSTQYSKPVSEEQADTECLALGEMRMDRQRREVVIADRSVDLTAKEFDLLWFFANNPGRVYTRSDLLAEVWGYGYDGYEHTVNSHINRLRKKIEKDFSDPQWIQTVWGVGYKFQASEIDRAHRKENS